MKILIIEDEYSLADAIAETLNRENYNERESMSKLVN